MKQQKPYQAFWENVHVPNMWQKCLQIISDALTQGQICPKVWTARKLNSRQTKQKHPSRKWRLQKKSLTHVSPSQAKLQKDKSFKKLQDINTKWVKVRVKSAMLDSFPLHIWIILLSSKCKILGYFWIID